MTSSAIGDPSFDRYARMVRRSLNVPLALVSLVEPERQVFPGADGLPADLEATRQTPISHSICQYVVADDAPLIVPDTSIDQLLVGHPAVRDLNIQAYAGWPITDHRGVTIGSLCALDYEPHKWTQEELAGLEDLAAACSAEIAQRELRVEADHNQLAAERLTARSQALLTLSQGLADVSSLAEVSSAIERVALRELGCKRAGLWVDAALLGPARSGSVGHPPEALTFVPNDEVSWRAAEAHSVVPVSSEHPVSACLAQRAPMFFRSLAEQDEQFPLVPGTPSAGEARAFLPLSMHREALGALVLTWEGERTFTPEERDTVRALAAFTAQAVSRSLLVEERLLASRTLQNAMLTELPQPDHLELVARYRPASTREQIGGDWYDAVLLPSSCTVLTIGDIVGHDILAAADMSQVRSVLRGLAWANDESPAVTVATLDRALPGLGIPAMATLVFARIEQTEAQRAEGTRTLRWTNAGHPPPLLAEPDREPRWLAETPEPMLGVAPAHFRLDHTVTVPAGATLLLYTDGLVERRGEHLDTGLERMRALVAEHADVPLGELLDTLLDGLLDDHLSDDVAVLGVRFHAE